MVDRGRRHHTPAMRRYGELLRTPALPALLAGVIIGRLVQGMAPLAIVLLGYAVSGSYARAGLAAAAYAIALGLASPALGRLIDRIGQTGVLLVCAAGSALAYPALAASGPATLPLAAGLAGAVTPPLSACMRAVWADLLRGTDRLETAYALESTLQELTYILGPLVVAVLVAWFSPAAAVLAAGTTAVVGTLLFVSSRPSRVWRGQPRAAGWSGPLRSGGVRLILALGAANAAAFGVIEVAVPAFAERSGDPALAGWLLSVWSAGSLLGGLAYGTRRWSGDPRRRLVVLLTGHAGALALLTLAGTRLGLGLALLVLGCAVAPWIACSYLLLDRAAPDGTVTEAFTWLSSAFAAGLATGNTFGGLVVERTGPSSAFVLAAAFGLAATLVAAAPTMPAWLSPTRSRPT